LIANSYKGTIIILTLHQEKTMPPLRHQSKHTIASLSELACFTQALAVALRPGDVVALDGTLGAGKTTLVQQLGHALGLTETISSPTFVLMNEYLSGPYPVAHVDLYRLGPERAKGFSHELYPILDEGRALILIEWACYGPFLKDDISIALQIDRVSDTDSDSDQTRLITLSANRPLNLQIAIPVSHGAAGSEHPLIEPTRTVEPNQ
jgi:tRNA threonylcarbamoyladenosine biosynthesis protein TsaE